jgi:hypothetical protein
LNPTVTPDERALVVGRSTGCNSTSNKSRTDSVGLGCFGFGGVSSRRVRCRGLPPGGSHGGPGRRCDSQYGVVPWQRYG